MKKMSKFLQLFLVVGLILSLGSIASAQCLKDGMKYTKKVDNFIVIYDASGSMGRTYGDTGQTKAALSKQLLVSFNNMLPELDYKAGLAKFASYEMIADMAPYRRAAFGQAIGTINENVLTAGFIGNPTPLGVGFQELEAVIKTLKGKTALILLSDCGQNTDIDPEKVIPRLMKQYDLCLHLVSFAQTLAEKAVEAELSKHTKCQVVADYAELGNDKARCEFLKKIFWDEAAAEMKAEPKCKNVPADLELDKDGCPIPVAMEIKVLFDFDKSDVKPEYLNEVKKFAEFAKQYPDKTFTIEGHTDAMGSDEYNQKLSMRRAQAVVDMLVSKYGIPASRIKAVGYGEGKPVATNDTAEGRAKNRRTMGVIDGVYKKKSK